MTQLGDAALAEKCIGYSIIASLGRVRSLAAFSRAREANPSGAWRRRFLFLAKFAGGRGAGAIGGGRAQRATGSTSPPPDRNIMGRSALRRVLALSFGLDFIHWRRCGES